MSGGGNATLTIALALLGEPLSPQEQAVLEALCRASDTALAGQLRPGVSRDDCEDAFGPAAAWLALDAWLVGRGAGEPAAFSAGDVTVRSGGGETGRQLREQAWRVMAPWVAHRGFAFRGVSG